MTLQQLKCFIITANSSSIAKAAERLYVTRSSLSGTLRDLEAEIDRDLFFAHIQRNLFDPSR